MKIVMVTDHNCIRVFKEALPLIRRGHEVHLVTASLGTGHNFYHDTHYYWVGNAKNRMPQDKSQFWRIIKEVAKSVKPDIWHIHNEPDWICTETLRIVKPLGQKVVWDIHDPESARMGSIPIEEHDIMQAVDGLVYVSDEEKVWMEKYHERVKNIPNVVILSTYPTELLKPPTYNYKLPNSIVYEGGIAEPGCSQRMGMTEVSPGKSVQGYNMRDLGSIVEAFVREGYGFHIYGSDATIGEYNRISEMYRELGAHSERVCDPMDLLAEMSKYRYGFVGFPTKVPLFDMALPNKFWDYMTAGVVPIIINAPAAGKIAEDNGLGIWLKDSKEAMRVGFLRTLLDRDLTPYYENIKKFMPKILMENQTPKLEAMYQAVIDAK